MKYTSSRTEAEGILWVVVVVRGLVLLRELWP